MTEHKPQIIAKDIEEFKLISDTISKLPDCIFEQIAIADKGLIGITCEIQNKTRGTDHLYLPANITKINDFGSYIGIYTDAVVFKITGILKEQPINFVFIDCKK